MRGGSRLTPLPAAAALGALTATAGVPALKLVVPPGGPTGEDDGFASPAPLVSRP